MRGSRRAKWEPKNPYTLNPKLCACERPSVSAETQTSGTFKGTLVSGAPINPKPKKIPSRDPYSLTGTLWGPLFESLRPLYSIEPAILVP